jgi:hypothetical protein
MAKAKDIWVRVRIRLSTAYRAALLFQQESDLTHAIARIEKDPALAKALRDEADNDSDSSYEFNVAINKIQTGEADP